MAASYEVQNITEDQIPDPAGSGDLIGVFDITYTDVAHGGQFTIQVLESGNPVKVAHDEITAKVAQIDAIYAGSSG